MDLFDLIGPVMIGPSSSHTAGAARIGLTARMLLNEDVKHAQIGFHGSFAKTYRGHGTDRAIVGGLMGMAVDDARLRESLELAQEIGMSVDFDVLNIRGAHPNTVRLTLTGISGKELTMEAVWARAYKIADSGDSGGWRMAFSVKYGDIIIEVRTKGVDPQWIYDQLIHFIAP